MPPGWAGSRAVSDEGVEAALAAYDRVVEAGRRDADLAEANRWFEAAPSPPEFVENWAEVDERLWGSMKRKFDHDPIPHALRLRCPQLAIFGGADELVPVADSVALFTAAAAHPDRGRRWPSSCSRRRPPRPRRRRRPPRPGYLDALTRWITAHAG
ncbi:alpha/beta hydrolase family protein [Saccharothrix sp. NRRL B-16348]|uniref:alpha/beta hydrolase family protein n=1 Tax=Saccharothrix sp. NRRL B-16348 TaxID=1415542 RepID=UPI000A7B7BC4|nr:hypothetical protein [Saccharothrix sp. NRRL B-16348]